jgi:uncharacterized protein (DUF1800 family)
MTARRDPWAPYEPATGNPWDLGKVAHLHRRAGFGVPWRDLQRDLAAGPAASVNRLLAPPAPSAEERQALDGLRRDVLASRDSERLKAWWLLRIVFDPDPLREKLTLFWHSHFATSNRKVRSVALMLGQNELFRRHALGEFADLLTGIVSDPAMLIWLDGAESRRERPNENFAREFLELFTVGPGNYTEADIRAAARAFTGWVRDADTAARAGVRRFRFEPARFDGGAKTFLGQTGRWRAEDIVRLTLERPAAAEFLCRKLYRFFISDSAEPSADLIRPLAAQLRNNRYSIRHVVGIILRSEHFFAQGCRRQKVAGPVEFSAGLLRTLEVPRADVRLLALAAACDRQGQELCYPPDVRGWVAGRTWLNTTTLLSRTNWCNDAVWGNPAVGMPACDPLAWARRCRIAPARATAALLDLLLQGDVGEDDRALIVRAGADGRADSLRRALQLILHCPQCQLA